MARTISYNRDAGHITLAGITHLQMNITHMIVITRPDLQLLLSHGFRGPPNNPEEPEVVTYDNGELVAIMKHVAPHGNYSIRAASQMEFNYGYTLYDLSYFPAAANDRIQAVDKRGPSIMLNVHGLLSEHLHDLNGYMRQLKVAGEYL